MKNLLLVFMYMVFSIILFVFCATEKNPIENDTNLEDKMTYTLKKDVLKKSLIRVGNTYRLAKFFEKASNGETVTIASIGGSITEGVVDNGGNQIPYGTQLVNVLREEFKNSNITHLNAGESGTPSTLGVMRVQYQVLDKKPDLVIIEFAVNDGSSDSAAYEGLVRKILNDPSKPAVLLLFTCNNSGGNGNEANQTKIGNNYDLPMVSVRTSVYSEISAGHLTWADYSPDNVHPSTKGHGMITELLHYCIHENNKKYLENPSDEYILPDKVSFANADYFENMVFVNKTNYTETEIFKIKNTGSFTQIPTDLPNGKPYLQNGWKRAGGTNNAPFEFEVTAREVFLIYWNTHGYGGPKTGKLISSVDIGSKNQVAEMQTWGTPNWPNLISKKAAPVKSVISLEMQNGSTSDSFWIIGIAFVPF